MHGDGTHPQTCFPCALPLPGQTLLLKKNGKYFIRKELVHLCAHQEGGIQAPHLLTHLAWWLAPLSARRAGAWAAAGKLGSLIHICHMLDEHFFYCIAV